MRAYPFLGGLGPLGNTLDTLLDILTDPIMIKAITRFLGSWMAGVLGLLLNIVIFVLAENLSKGQQLL